MGTTEAWGHEGLGDKQAGRRAAGRVAAKLPQGLRSRGAGGAGTRHPPVRWRRELEGRWGSVRAPRSRCVGAAARRCGRDTARPARLAGCGCVGWPPTPSSPRSCHQRRVPLPARGTGRGTRRLRDAPARAHAGTRAADPRPGRGGESQRSVVRPAVRVPWCVSHKACPAVRVPWCASHVGCPTVCVPSCVSHGACPMVCIPCWVSHGACPTVQISRCVSHSADLMVHVPRCVSHNACPAVHVPWCASHGACPMVQISWCVSHNSCPAVRVPWCSSHVVCPAVHVLWSMSHGACPMVCILWCVPHNGHPAVRVPQCVSHSACPMVCIPCCVSHSACPMVCIPWCMSHAVCPMVCIPCFVSHNGRPAVRVPQCVSHSACPMVCIPWCVSHGLHPMLCVPQWTSHGVHPTVRVPRCVSHSACPMVCIPWCVSHGARPTVDVPRRRVTKPARPAPRVPAHGMTRVSWSGPRIGGERGSEHRFAARCNGPAGSRSARGGTVGSEVGQPPRESQAVATPCHAVGQVPWAEPAPALWSVPEPSHGASTICQCPAAPRSALVRWAPGTPTPGCSAPDHAGSVTEPGSRAAAGARSWVAAARGQGADPGGMQLAPGCSLSPAAMLRAGLLDPGGFGPQLSSSSRLGKPREDSGPGGCGGGVLQQFLSGLGVSALLQSLAQSPAVLAGLGSSSQRRWSWPWRWSCCGGDTGKCVPRDERAVSPPQPGVLGGTGGAQPCSLPCQPRGLSRDRGTASGMGWGGHVRGLWGAPTRRGLGAAPSSTRCGSSSEPAWEERDP